MHYKKRPDQLLMYWFSFLFIFILVAVYGKKAMGWMIDKLHGFFIQ